MFFHPPKAHSPLPSAHSLRNGRLPTMNSAERPRTTLHYDQIDDRERGLSKVSTPLTFNFFILPPIPHLDSHSFLSSIHLTPSHSLCDSSRLSATAASTTNSSGFLTSLAAQERRLLELREELQRAELELSHLKTQWAQYEAGRMRSELRHVG